MSGIFGGRPKVQQPQAAAALTIQQSAYGTPVYLLYGTNRIYGNLIWYGAFQQQQVSTGSGAGGKGGVVGGGGKGGGSTEYNYFASFDIGLCEGPIQGIGQVYVSKQISDLPTLNGELFNGTQGQQAPGYMLTNFPTQAQNYTELAHVLFPNFALGTSSETPQFSFEVFGQFLYSYSGGNYDCSPEVFFIDFLTRAGLPADQIGDFSALGNYCRAMGFFISPKIDQQRTAIDWLNEVMMTLNAEFVWSNNKLTAVTYADSPVSSPNGSYTPNLTPIYNIGYDDYIRDGDEDPVKATRSDAQDVYNQVPIEYVNKADQYNVETYTAFDDALVDSVGFRAASTLTAHHVTNAPTAQLMAQLWMNRQLFTRTQYTFKLPWNYILLDPMDYISLTEPGLGLNNALVRIVDIEEDEKGELTFTVEEVPGAIAAPALQPSFGATRSTPDYNQSVGSVNTPIFFETPLALVQSNLVELNIAVSGANPLFGGCDVYVSTDNETFQYVSQFNGNSRMGVLTSALASFTPTLGGNNIDTSSTLQVSMTESNSNFNNAAVPADAINLNSLCWVDGEFLAFGSDNLTAPNAYSLSYLNRGAYGSTIAAHAKGALFARYDNSIFAYEVNQSYVGNTLYFKFLAYNAWGGGVQSLDEVSSYSYQVLGTALLTPLANPTNLTVSYTDNIAQLNWLPISDLRTPILYQIRKGSSFLSAQVVGYTSDSSFIAWGNDTYWISAYYLTPFGVQVYSASPPSISVTTGALQNFLIESYEEDPSWTGTCSGGAVVSGSDIVLEGSGDILTDPDINTTPDIIFYGGSVSQSGTYTAPSGHTITSNYVIRAKVMCNWSLSGINISGSDDINTTADILAVQDVLDGAAQALVYAQPQIRLSQNGGSTYGAWQNWIPGVYQFNAIQFRINIYSLSTQIQAVLSAFGFEVDVPQLVQTGSLSTSGSGNTTVTFTNEFNISPVINAQIVNASPGDIVVISSVGASSFAIEVLNSGSPVVRTVSWTATGY